MKVFIPSFTQAILFFTMIGCTAPPEANEVTSTSTSPQLVCERICREKYGGNIQATLIKSPQVARKLKVKFYCSYSKEFATPDARITQSQKLDRFRAQNGRDPSKEEKMILADETMKEFKLASLAVCESDLKRTYLWPKSPELEGVSWECRSDEQELL